MKGDTYFELKRNRKKNFHEEFYKFKERHQILSSTDKEHYDLFKKNKTN